ncbi:MAG: hypothetical protein GY818_18200 [Planctomycetaceae bacterium]|nr:hypothetical protein [Planctomycetaceae bacterium]
MEIKNFRYRKPDYDGDTQFGVSVTIKNEARECAKLVVQKMIFKDNLGRPISESEMEHECDIEPGDSGSFEDNWLGTSNKLLFGDLATAQVSATATLCKLNFGKSSQIPISTNALEVTGSGESFKIEEIIEVSGISAWLTEPDRDGDSDLQIRASFINLTKKTIPKVIVKAQLSDKLERNLNINNAQDSCAVSGHSIGMADLRIYCRQDEELDGAKLCLEFSVFSEISYTKSQKSGAAFDARW